MARLTTRIRNDISKDPFRKVKEQAVLPAWFNGAGMIIAAVVLAIGVIFIGVKAFTDDTPPVTPPPNQAESAPQQQYNPYADTEDGATESTTDSPSSSTSPTEEKPKNTAIEGDFAALDTVSIAVETSSLNSRVPEGAMNVALAGAQAMTLGDWDGVPVDGTPREDRYEGAEIDIESVRLAEPTPADADSSTQYTFLFDGVSSSGDNVQLSVTTQWGTSTYEVVAF